MQFSVLKTNGRNLARGCAILVVAAAASGCSSQVARFSDGLDGVTTASTISPRPVFGGQASQPYPGDTGVQQVAQPAPMTGGGYASGPVGRSALQPVSAQPLPPVAQAQTQAQASPAPAAPAPVRVASAPAAPSLDRTTTGTVKEPAGTPFKPAQPDARLADQKVPAPLKQKTETVAVLPQQPKLKDGKATVDASTANDPKLKKVAAAGPGTYVVQSGDTLSAISRKTGASVTALKQANGMQDGLIRVGQKLTIPAAGAPVALAATQVAAAKPVAVDPVKTASTPPAAQPTQTLASYTPPTKKADKAIEQVQDDGAAAPGSTGIGKMRWPVRGRVISGFGGGGDGIDISVPKGTPVKAAENGVVIYAGDGLKEFGNTVLVRHDNGLVTVYGNASELSVTRGQKVKRGQEIALSGMSGNATAPKLHFEIRKNSAPVDPSTYLE